MTAELEQSTPGSIVERREERSPTNWIATIRLRDGTEIPCTVKDVSKSGAKIGVTAKQSLPPVFMLRIIGRDFLCLVRLAWRRGDYAGVRIERVGKVPSAAKTTDAFSSGDERSVESGGIGVPSRKRGISAF
ncbi:PilZ domain-containing protein [Methylobacterium sp. J-068]|uniref:PilZ domain-containing protein n=1 Tax=Methylobacterium sp. J-068 TaxID=2836649 RepID=UPI001FBB1997|nr:PilZ domain-containing protein [Methylobacterium sp. J-068]MCJ2033567.1 PilZ domain-containing protein [Methylobacterium sp. J-068]